MVEENLSRGRKRCIFARSLVQEDQGLGRFKIKSCRGLVVHSIALIARSASKLPEH